MIKMKNVSKIYNKTILKNINFDVELRESVVITGDFSESSNVLLKMLAGIYQVETGEYTHNNKNVDSLNNDFFFIAMNLNYSNFNTVQDLINYYALYYNTFDLKTIGFMLNSVNITTSELISNYTISEIKMLYLILSIQSGASFIFIENLFYNVEQGIVLKMKDIILKGQKASRSFIMTSNHIDDYDGLVDSIVFIRNNTAKKFNLEFFDSFYKCSVIYKEKVEESSFRKYNPLYLKVYRRNIIIILKNDNISINSLVEDTTPIYYDKVQLDLSDIFYCLGDNL